MWPFVSRPPTPPRIQSDTVLPLCHQDDNLLYRSIFINLLMRFDLQLDREKLCTSLERLLSRDGWNKFGARLRLNKDGKLEYHIPVEFSKDRPSFRYSQTEYTIGIGEHPLASQLPKASARPSVSRDPRSFESLMEPPDGPKTLHDYTTSDEPQLGVHVVFFTNATLVTIRWPHTMTDAMGLHALLSAWSLVLQGRDSEVPLVHGIDFYPLEPLGNRQTAPYGLADQCLTGWKMFCFVLRYVWELVRYSEETRVICLPSSYVTTMRRNAIDDLSAGTDGEKTFLSEGDVLCAWWARHWIAHVAPDSDRTVLLANAFNLRPILAKDLLPSEKVYLANAVSGVSALLPAKDIFSRPLWSVASAVRLSIDELGTRQQLEALEAMQKVSVSTTGYLRLFGSPSMHMIQYSNWTKAKFFETDFSAAIIPDAKESPLSDMHKTRGIPSSIQSGGYVNGLSPRNLLTIVGKDAEGNYWMFATLRKGMWDRIVKNLEAEAPLL